jgi:NADP-dependent 3-hydroxy acid dehydrogenase YdfG
MNKVWFITGTSKGFGRIWAEAALQRGDKVIATARNLDSLQELNEKYGENVLTLASGCHQQSRCIHDGQAGSRPLRSSGCHC